MKSRWIIGMLITGGLVISAVAQDNGATQLTDGVVASLPRQQSNNTRMPPVQGTRVLGDTEAYLQPMQGVLESLAEELGLIAQGVREGKITRAQAEYLSAERYYTGLMRLQLLRTLHQNADEGKQSQSYSPANLAPNVSGETVVVSPPTSSPDIVPPLAIYLGLNPAQLAAIQRQITVDREEVRPLLKRLEKSRRDLVSATLNGKCDVKKIETLAAEQSRILKQLIVAETLLEAKVYSMLTSEQQQKADELRSQSVTLVKPAFPEWTQE